VSDRIASRRGQLTKADFVRLAAFRHALRRFLRFSESAARGAGLTGQHYQALLALRGSPEGEHMAINDLARHLLIKHNSAVGLVDRLAARGLVVRERIRGDRRKVQLRLTRTGEGVLEKLASVHRQELRRVGPIIQGFLKELVDSNRTRPVGPERLRGSARAVRGNAGRTAGKGVGNVRAKGS